MLLTVTWLLLAGMVHTIARPVAITQAASALQEEPPGTGPRGTSRSPGQEGRYDSVGYASWYGEELGASRTASGRPFDPNAMIAAHRTLPLGSFAEVTSLKSGKTIVVLIDDRGPTSKDREIDLSRAAATQLGIDRAGVGPVRVRRIEPPASDQIALRAGRPAAERLDTPPVLLRALLKQLSPVMVGTLPQRVMTPTRPNPAPPLSSRPGAGFPVPGQTVVAVPTVQRAKPATGFAVQVAALSNPDRAQSLAQSLGGAVLATGSIYRVRIGPFGDLKTANRARDDMARRGYGDARIVRDEQ